MSLSFAALAGCEDREAPTAVAREAQRPTLTVAGADYVVTTAADGGAGSLREAILAAKGADVAKTIGFAIPSSDAGCSAANVCTISLTTTLPTITNPAGLTIDGTGQQITVSGQDVVQVMVVGSGTVATIKRLAITHGHNADYGPECGFATGAAGGICSTGTLTVIEASFSRNRAGSGAAIGNIGGVLSVIGTTFSENSAILGAAVQSYGPTTIANSTFTDNTAQAGGALDAGGETSITNSTFSGNIAFYGPSIFNEGVVVRLRNTILADGANLINCFQYEDDLVGRFIDEGGNLSFADRSCPGFNADPKLGPLQVNAPGLTATRSLLDDSPAIGLGVPANCPATDQRGAARPQPVGGRCDSGAYESALGPIDDTPPVVTPTIDGTLGTNDWYRSTVSVSWSVAETGSLVTSAPCAPTTISSDTPGQVVSCSATSHGGTSTQFVTIKRDGTAPTLAPVVVPNPVLLNGTATATPNATDPLSGLESASCGTPTTTTVGSKSVSCTATDQAGNTNTVAANYIVTYPFTGFLQPVDPMPTVNVVKAGSGVQVKFGLGGNQGLAIFAAGSPASQQVSCDASAPQDDIEATVTTGNSSLSYDASTQQYGYTWKTDKAWAGTCRMLNITLVDGTTHQASFRLK